MRLWRDLRHCRNSAGLEAARVIVTVWRFRGSQERIRRATESEYRHAQAAHSIEQQRWAEQQVLRSATTSLQQAVLRPSARKTFSPNLRWAADEVHDRQCWIGACTLNEGVVPAFLKHSHEIDSFVLQYDERGFSLDGITHEITDWRQIVAGHHSSEADF